MSNSYRPGPALGVCGPRLAVLVDLPSDDQLVADLFTVVSDSASSVDEVLEVLVSRGLRAIADFAVAEWQDDGVRAVVRGRFAARFGDPAEPVTGRGLWNDQMAPGGSVELVDPTADPSAESLPVAQAVVRAGSLRMGESDESAAGAEADAAIAAEVSDEPQEAPAPSGEGEDDHGDAVPVSGTSAPEASPGAEAAEPESTEPESTEPASLPDDADEPATPPEQEATAEPLPEAAPAVAEPVPAPDEPAPQPADPPPAGVPAFDRPVAAEIPRGHTLPAMLVPAAATAPATPVPPPRQPAPPPTGAFIDSIPWSTPEAGPADATMAAPPVAPAPDLTINRADLPDPRAAQPGVPTVVAVRCGRGHLSPAYAGVCRVCGDSLPPQQPFETPRPPLGQLRFSNGEVVLLDRPCILGRNPRVPAGYTNSQPNLVRLADPDKDISSQHLEVGIDFWHVTVKDLGSTNGTELVAPGEPPLSLRPDDPVTIEPGSTVVLAGVLSFTFEVVG